MTAPEPEGRSPRRLISSSGADLGTLSTEIVRPELQDLDLMSTEALVVCMAQEFQRAGEAVAKAAPEIIAVVDRAAECLGTGGRLVYVGAGSAGRIAVLDAAELGPTFSLPDGVVEAVIAGGDTALRHAVEGAEDDQGAGAQAVDALGVAAGDVVIGVSASGRTPFVLGALEHARRCGAATVAICCNAGSPMSKVAEYAVETVVGGEVIAGSSRLNAGTAQKMVLNTISTAVMVKLGKTYGNLMVDLRPTNSKLRDRAVRIVQEVAGTGPEAARQALEASSWDTKLACLAAWSGRDAAVVGPVLARAGGHLRQAMRQLKGATGTN